MIINEDTVKKEVAIESLKGENEIKVVYKYLCSLKNYGEPGCKKDKHLNKKFAMNHIE